MAEDHLRNQRFAYSTNANLVLQADRGEVRRARGEATGEVESIRNKINFKMGDRAGKSVMFVWPCHRSLLYSPPLSINQMNS
jgi:hypothetical protein